MINEKPYYNKGLEAILNLYITKEKYGDFTLILQEIFQRRAYEFGFKNDQMIDEIENFVKNVNIIKFVPKEEMSSEKAMGVYCSSEGEIRLNQDYFNQLKEETNEIDLGEELYEVLTHEVYHAISHKKDENYLGLTYINKSTGERYGTALNEICTETGADRASISRTSNDAEKGRRDTKGYSDITFIANLLAVSFGLTEKEFLAAGLQNRGELSKAIFSKFPENNIELIKKIKSEIFDSLEININALYNLSYKDEDNKIIDKDMKKDLLTKCLGNIYIKTYGLSNAQIANDSRENLKELSAELTYRFQKMERIMKDSLNDFYRYGRLTKEDIEKIKTNTIMVRENIATRISGIKLLEQQGFKIQDEDILKEQLQLAKTGNLYKEENIQMLQEKYGIDVQYPKIEELKETTQDHAYSSYVLKEDFDNGQKWDNIGVAIVMRRTFENHMKRVYESKSIEQKDEEIKHDEPEEFKEKIGFFEKVRNNIRNIISRFKNRNLKQLPPVEERIDETLSGANNISAHENWAKQYEVAKEKLIPMEEVLNQNSEKNKDYSKDENIKE